MRTRPSQGRRLAQELLAVHRHCTEESCPRAAELVMQALEELAKDRPWVQETVDRAYLEALPGAAPRESDPA